MLPRVVFAVASFAAVAQAAPATTAADGSILLDRRASLRLATGDSMQSGIVSSTLRWQSSGELFYDNCPPQVRIGDCYQMHLDSVGNLQRRSLDQGGVPLLDLALDPFQIGQFQDTATIDDDDDIPDHALPSDVFYDDDEVEEPSVFPRGLVRRQTMFCKLTSDCAGATIPANSHNYCDAKAGTCTFRCNTNYTLVDGVCKRSCTLTSACTGQKIPANSHQYCDQSVQVCSYRCNNGYTLNPWTKLCQADKGTTTTTTTTAAASLPTSGTQQQQNVPCSITSQCAGLSVPDNARNYCDPSKKVCTFLCNSGYTLNPWTKLCQKNSGGAAATTSSTTLPTGANSGASRPCSSTSQCAGISMPANSHEYCDPAKKTCTWLCDSGYTLNPWSKTCTKNGVTTTTTQKTTTTSSRTTTTTTKAVVTTTSKSSSTSTTSSAAASSTSSVVACKLTVDCTEAGTVIPAFSNRWCNGSKGVCSWRCMTGYTQVNNSCVKADAASAVVPSSIVSSSVVLTATSSTSSSAASSTSTKTPRQRIEMLSWPPAAAGTTFNYQWKSHLASPASSGYQFFHVMQLLRRVDGGAYVIALSIKNGQVYIDDIARDCGLGSCPSIPLSSILDRTLQHNATVTWGTVNGSFDYTVSDALTKLPILTYSAKGYMGDQGSLKYGVYRAYVSGLSDLNNYVGDHVAVQLK
ncbi:hypothetical protein ACM66B_001703 [Microbotryomycetes sp. NB124-2]